MTVNVAVKMRTNRAPILAAFAAVYVLWGSTYLAIRVAVQELPPLFLGGLRFGLAGLLMLAFVHWRRLPQPARRADWLYITVTSLLLLVSANGLVCIGEKDIPSSQTALIVSSSALWIPLFSSWVTPREQLPASVLIGLLLGFVGVAVLVGAAIDVPVAPARAYAALLLSPVFWALGTIYAQRANVRMSSFVVVAWQMLLAGGILLIVASYNEPYAINWTSRSIVALAWLACGGSCIAYGAYFWLIHQVSPTLVGTSAYVNPAVAALLGAWLLDEHLQPVQWAGMAVILVSVAWVSVMRTRKP